jgi:2-dehydro-3-deoxygluconokinase
VLIDRSVVFGNESECAACFGAGDPASLAAARRDAAGPLIVKAGADGCVLIEGDRIARIPAAGRVESGDSTGAGDAFDAAFIAARLRGASLRDACAAGNAAGALAAATRGPRPSGLAAIADPALHGADRVPAP